MNECCELMERCVHLWMDKAAGLVKVSMANAKSKVGGVEITERYAYREKPSLKSQIIYINFCPWCGKQYNKDLQK